MMMTVKTTYIINRKGTLYFRIRVPEDCQTALGGKHEVKKSLGLKADDKAEQGKAITQAGLLAAEWNETFDRIRNSGNTSKGSVHCQVWDLYDHHRTVSQNKPVMRRLLNGYFEELENQVLNDPQCGIFQTPLGKRSADDC